MPKRSKVKSVLTRCLLESVERESRKFRWDSFFNKWYRQEGDPLFFLFKRHLGVTNTQYVELFSLLQNYANADTKVSPRHSLLFHSTSQIMQTLSLSMSSLLDEPNIEIDDAVGLFVDTYFDVFALTAAVDSYYCSCAVFLPPGLNVDIYQITADSGYIHSSGRSIYIRRTPKAAKIHLFANITSHLKKFPIDNEKIPFIVYSHEDFSRHDTHSIEQIGKGIGDTKLYFEKMSMGRSSLPRVINELKKEFSDFLHIPSPGNYKSHQFYQGRSLWLISDRAVDSANPRSRGEESYYICFEQSVKNINPFFFFDENKPAWKSHTTLPHSLTSALINATLPHKEDTTICDPFGGTGTSWFELTRLNRGATILCPDLSPATNQLVRDNLVFFQMSAVELGKLQAELRIVREAVLSKSVNENETEGQAVFEFELSSQHETDGGAELVAFKMLNELRDEQPDEEQEFIFSDRFVQRLSELGFIARVIFYLALRAELRFQLSFERRSTTFEKAFAASVKTLLREIEELQFVRSSIESGKCIRKGNYLVRSGRYSSEVLPAFFIDGESMTLDTLDNEVFSRDCRSLEPNSIDVIICDPPYGFNTSESTTGLGQLYSEFIESALGALRNKGHLIICLPKESFTGQGLPYCTRPNVVINQVLVKSRAMDKAVYVVGESVPNTLFSPPYYWVADKALERIVLHFRVFVASK